MTQYPLSFNRSPSRGLRCRPFAAGGDRVNVSTPPGGAGIRVYLPENEGKEKGR